MKHVLFRLTILLGLAMTATPAIADTIVTSNDGGIVQDFYVEVMSHAMRKERIIVDGPCYSACTLSLYLAPKGLMCATPRALFGFHRAYSGNKGTPEYEDDGGWTAALERFYPAPITGFLKAHGGMTHNWVLLAGEEMEAIVPMCPADTVKTGDEDKMLVPDQGRQGSTGADARRTARTGQLPAPQRAR